ncbi:LacI family DNA-binding transcriptional regulator [Aquibacillus salsiterrae]|uniref:LacI family DNA-binding transcriptional regulator n=1 Tax=Aquibacillus salsiterrae TaxID=2950439 RepID=A0A9X3WGS6_9BACI|nr:LacI family DNA-binding transcriptional regulator [Aquibacillus salsiterrae]MDC3418353.1 LacI family DNA-binding transcriptional regulator [Aquibacillus salsiterrae]
MSRVTMQMISEVAGYSKYVVSKTLNNQPGVKDSTRQKILQVAKQLGYFKETTPLQVLNKPNNSIFNDGFVLVVMPNHRYQNEHSSYWSKIFNGIVDSLEELDIGAMVISSQNNLSDHVKTDSLLGIITVGLVSTDMLLKLSEHSVPFVMVDHEDPIIKADAIFMDNFDGVYKLTNHLIGLGHKKLCFIGDNGYSRSFHDRWLGFRSALEAHHLFTDVERKYLLDMDYTNPVEDQFRSFFLEPELHRELPTAFVCANDEIATKIMELLIASGFGVPKDFSVTGFDNIDYKSKINPPLTTVQVLKESIGRRTVHMLLWRVNNLDFPPEKVLISSEMIIRKSVGFPNNMKTKITE